MSQRHRRGGATRLILAILFTGVGLASTDFYFRVLWPRFSGASVDVAEAIPEFEGTRSGYGEPPNASGGGASTSGPPPMSTGDMTLGVRSPEVNGEGEHPGAGSAGLGRSFQWTTRGGAYVSPDTAVGGAGTYLLHGSEYTITGALAPHPEDPRSVSPEGIGRQDEKFLRVTEEWLKRRSVLPSEPWEWDRFQAVGSLDTGFPTMIIGRDFSVPASPDDSVSWFESQIGQDLTEADREVAVQILRDWETERRVLLGEIIDHVVEMSEDQSERYDDFIAYALIEGKLVLFRRGEVQPADRVITAGSRLYQEIEEEAKALCP